MVGGCKQQSAMGLCLPASVILVGLLRYAHLLERLGPSLLNTLGLATGWVCAAGLTMVGNFQVRHLLGGVPRGRVCGGDLGWSGAVAALGGVGFGVVILVQPHHLCMPSPPLVTALPQALGLLFACVLVVSDPD